MADSTHSNEVHGQIGSVVQVGNVAGDFHAHAHTAVLAKPRQLPPPIGHFTGRREQLRDLDELLEASSPGVVISAMSGMAGVGKTALAVHWSHRVADRFPDGQLYVDLRGYDNRRQMSSDDVLAGFIRALGAAEVPSETDERVSCYRSLIADRRMLVVLDNARTAEQVLPLLPATSSCFVIVTSRDPLPGLRVQYAATGLDLDLLSQDEAMRLLRSAIGTRVDSSPEAALALVRLCANLPLALRIAAEAAAGRPSAALSGVVAELAAERRLLGVAEDDRSIRTVFSWSLGHLDDGCRSVFRSLGLHPGREYDVEAVSALTCLDSETVRRAMEVLARAHLVKELAERRFTMHDLLAEYSRELAEQFFHDVAARSAVKRLRRHYSLLAGKAAESLVGHRVHYQAVPPDSPLAVARAWFEVEGTNVELCGHVEPNEHDKRGTLEKARFLRDIAVLNGVVADTPRALGLLEESRRTYRTVAPELGLRLDTEEAEVLMAAGMPSEALLRLSSVWGTTEGTGMTLERTRLSQYTAIAALACGDLPAAARLARSAQLSFARNKDLHAAALCGMTVLTTATLDPQDLAKRDLHQWLDFADLLRRQLKQLGMSEEEAFVGLLEVRLGIAQGNLDEAARLLELVVANEPPVEYMLLRRLCRAELRVAEGDHDSALAEVATGFAEAERHKEKPATLSPVPVRTAYGRLLRFLALDIAVGRRDLHALLNVAERTVAQPPMQAFHLVSPAVETAELDEVIARVGDDALIRHVVVRDDLFALVVSRGEADVVDLGPVEEVRECVRRLHTDRNALAPDYMHPALLAVINESARKQIDKLDLLLRKPLDRWLDVGILVIVPTDVLHSISWSVLPGLHGHPVVIAPSVSMWLHASKCAARHVEAGRSVFVEGPGLVHLWGEFERLSRFHPQPAVFAGDEATVQTVMKALEGVDVAHLAAHGSHETDNAAFSRLELVDGPLFAHEFAKVERPPQTVVLAGCELAISRRDAGEEALGYAHALLAAGVATVIASPNKVGDEAAAATLADYHRALSQGHTPAVALAEAVAKDPLRRPYFCIGSGGT